ESTKHQADPPEIRAVSGVAPDPDRARWLDPDRELDDQRGADRQLDRSGAGAGPAARWQAPFWRPYRAPRGLRLSYTIFSLLNFAIGRSMDSQHALLSLFVTAASRALRLPRLDAALDSLNLR